MEKLSFIISLLEFSANCFNIRAKKVTVVSQHLLCIGASGTGKSTIKGEVEKAYPRSGEPGSPVIPILTVDTPALLTIKNIAETMLFALGDPFVGKGKAKNKTVRILVFLENIWNDAPDELNLFHEKLIKQPLTKINIPFHVVGGYNEFKL